MATRFGVAGRHFTHFFDRRLRKLVQQEPGADCRKNQGKNCESTNFASFSTKFRMHDCSPTSIHNKRYPPCAMVP